MDKVVFPVVVKPVDMSANRGVSYCYSKKELVEAYKYARSISKSDKIIVEKMLKGKEWYSSYAIVDGEIHLMSLNGMYAEPGELKNIYSITTTVSDNVERFCREINPKIEEVLRAVGCKQGLAWVQVMLDEDGKFYIIEMGYRLPGDMTFVSYKEMFDFDVNKWLVDYALGIKKPISEIPQSQIAAYKACGCCYVLWSKKECDIAEINGIDAVLQNKGFEYYSVNQIGSHIQLHAIIGVFTFTSADINEMIEKIKLINKTVSIFDTNRDDIIIHYSDFDYLKKVYYDGLNGQ